MVSLCGISGPSRGRGRVCQGLEMFNPWQHEVKRRDSVRTETSHDYWTLAISPIISDLVE